MRRVQVLGWSPEGSNTPVYEAWFHQWVVLLEHEHYGDERVQVSRLYAVTEKGDGTVELQTHGSVRFLKDAQNL